ncbi:N-acetylmuramoyl-L-alanine amidase [Aeromicrobium sp. UC242_57]|uniref:N-acetylmuramoyl-L-alanine amidase n=1 Tax=Aeromicrobium sp. UC242_57 TaxID=3374624 RepID=UPI00379CB862
MRSRPPPASTDLPPTPRSRPSSRAADGGASGGTKCDTPIAGDRTRGVVVHHTAGSNTYSKADSKAIVRSTQAYHMKARKWCDIGYNFLVDKYGQIFEGRAGGTDRAVRAAHSGNLAVNTYTMGVSMMGNYDVTKPSAALKTAMVKLVGWRLGTNYLPAKGTYTLGGKTLNMIAGHRNVISTACPGKYGYAWLSEKGGLRDRTEDYLANYSTPIKDLWRSLGSSKVGAIYAGEAKTSGGGRLRAKSMELLSASTGKAYSVSGAVLTEYNRMGSRSGDLGYPRTDASAVTGGTRQVFQKGRIYLAKGKSKAYSLTGAINTLYVKLGASTGALGVPTSSTTVSQASPRSPSRRGTSPPRAAGPLPTAAMAKFSRTRLHRLRRPSPRRRA